ncbi:MAG: hypothetical protein HRU01_06945 [Myxococcales bacterium]|nr:hypothetical protein [Myxococcales bacterium]
MGSSSCVSARSDPRDSVNQELAYGAPDVAGKRRANPTALLFSACEMLRYLAEEDAAQRIELAVHEVLADSRHHTQDLGGAATLDEFTAAVLERVHCS